MGDAGRIQGKSHPCRDLLSRQTQIAWGESHLLVHCSVEKLGGRVLKDETNVAGQFGRQVSARVQAIHLHLACHASGHDMGNESSQAKGQRALAAAGRPTDQHEGTRLHGQGDVGQGACGAVVDGEMANLDDGPSRARGHDYSPWATNCRRQ